MKRAHFTKDHAYRLCSSKYTKNIMQDPGQRRSSLMDLQRRQICFDSNVCNSVGCGESWKSCIYYIP